MSDEPVPATTEPPVPAIEPSHGPATVTHGSSEPAAPATDRRQTGRRYRRRADDKFQDTLQQVLLATGAIAIIYGQADILGEPWRHIITVGAVVALIVLAIWMKRT